MYGSEAKGARVSVGLATLEGTGAIGSKERPVDTITKKRLIC